jgi:Uma2 family endonuclease
MTVEEYFRTPETLEPMELIYGVLRVADAPTPRHQSVVGQMFFVLETHVRERRLGRMWLAPLDVVLDERKPLIVQPDLMFVSTARAGIVRDRLRGAPDLVVEVLSPHPRIGRTEERVAWFAEYGVRECWLVHQDRREVTVLEFEDGRTRSERVLSRRDPIQSRLLTGFTKSLDEILAE